MIKNGLEYKKCAICRKICLKPEITANGMCKDCLIEKMKCCENCTNYDGTDCNADHENDCKHFSGSKNGDDFWELKC